MLHVLVHAAFEYETECLTTNTTRCLVSRDPHNICIYNYTGFSTRKVHLVAELQVALYPIRLCYC